MKKELKIDAMLGMQKELFYDDEYWLYHRDYMHENENIFIYHSEKENSEYDPIVKDGISYRLMFNECICKVSRYKEQYSIERVCVYEQIGEKEDPMYYKQKIISDLQKYEKIAK